MIICLSKKGNKTCFYGDCPHCKKEKDKSLCVNDTMEGVVILWLPKKIIPSIRYFVHPWGLPCRDRTAIK